jgi:hypothetical protein
MTVGQVRRLQENAMIGLRINGNRNGRLSMRLRIQMAGIVVAAVCLAGPSAWAQSAKAFATPEQAVAALRDAAKARRIDPLMALLGADGRELVSWADPVTVRKNRDVFVVAMAEGWRLGDIASGRKELIVGKEAWPFPVPLVKTPQGWIFDAAAGKEEVLTRRIGHNELAAIRIARTYVQAQRVYARRSHDGKPAGLYARRFASTPGTQDGLYWTATPGQPGSPLGTLVAAAAAEGRAVGDSQSGPVPFYGYYFRVLAEQGPAAKGGAKRYVVGDVMSGGFALVAWPAEYGSTGITTFIVNQDGVVYERDLGAATSEAARGVVSFNPDKTWRVSEPSVP